MMRVLLIAFVVAGCSFDTAGDLPPDPREGENPGEGGGGTGGTGGDGSPVPACAEDSDCGPAVCPEFGECGGFEGECGTTGTRQRSCMVPTCEAGTCGQRAVSEAEACERDIEGQACGTTLCGAYSECVAPGDICSTEGTRGRSCWVSQCQLGACVQLAEPAIESEPCVRETEGKLCWIGQTCNPMCHNEYFHCMAGECMPDQG